MYLYIRIYIRGTSPSLEGLLTTVGGASAAGMTIGGLPVKPIVTTKSPCGQL